MRTRVVAGAVVGLIALVAVLLTIRQPFSVVAPAPELRSYGNVPTVIAGPAFYAGPIPPGLVVDQELRLTENDVAVRLWISPARERTATRARIELLAGPHGPSLRSGAVSLNAASGDLVARIVPPLRSNELGDDGIALLRVSPTGDSGSIRVGMASGATYPGGRVSIAGELQHEDQDLMFEVARELSPARIWSEVAALADTESLPLRSAAAVGPIVLAAGVAAASFSRNRRVPAALIIAVVAVVAGALIVVDRTQLSLFPGPDFNPTVLLR